MSHDSTYHSLTAGAEAPTVNPILLLALTKEETKKKAMAFGLQQSMELIVVVTASFRWPDLAGALAVGFFMLEVFRKPQQVATSIMLRVVDGKLVITGREGAPPLTAELSSVRDVEFERHSSLRHTHTPPASEMPVSVEAIDGVDLARVVVVFDGGAPRARLTEGYTPLFVCTERLGNVRAFLRSHGWKPLAERSDD